MNAYSPPVRIPSDNEDAAEAWAMPFGPALSPSVEPLRVSLPSGLQSLSQGDVQ